MLKSLFQLQEDPIFKWENPSENGLNSYIECKTIGQNGLNPLQKNRSFRQNPSLICNARTPPRSGIMLSVMVTRTACNTILIQWKLSLILDHIKTIRYESQKHRYGRGGTPKRRYNAENTAPSCYGKASCNDNTMQRHFQPINSSFFFFFSSSQCHSYNWTPPQKKVVEIKRFLVLTWSHNAVDHTD